MKFLLAILLSIIIISPLWLQVSMLKVEQEICKHQSKKHVFSLKESAKELVSFSFTQIEYDNIEWIEKDEFVIAGKMYDVVRRENVGQKIKLICWPDKKEGAIRQKIQALFSQKWQQNSSNRQKQHGQLEQLLKSYIFWHGSVKTHLTLLPPKLTFAIWVEKTRWAYIQMLLPPPK